LRFAANVSFQQLMSRKRFVAITK